MTAPKHSLSSLIGPGIITGASDDDPSGIATYSQVGAQFGLGMLWAMLFSFPLMSGIQEVCAQMGRVTGRGIAGNMREFYPRSLLYLTVALIVIANTVNLAADIAAMGEAITLLVPGDAALYAAFLTIASLWLVIFIPYHRYLKVLQWLSLTLFAYVATIFVVKIPWEAALTATFYPSFTWNRDFFFALVGVLGTTISPYLFFWQASQEVEDERLDPTRRPLLVAPDQATAELKRIHKDTYVGMGISNFVSYCIILTVAVTLHTSGIRSIDTAAQAAEALRPVAGEYAFALFTLGIVGMGLLAIPVLAGSVAYAVAEALDQTVGLEQAPPKAKIFYGVIAVTIVAALIISLLEINPMRALFWSAVINGLVAGPLMVIIMLMGSNPLVMGVFVLTRTQKFLGWLATLAMLGAGGALIVSQLFTHS